MSKEQNGVKYSAVLRAQLISIISLSASIVISLFSEPTSSSLVGTVLTAVGCVYLIKGFQRSEKYNK